MIFAGKPKGTDPAQQKRPSFIREAFNPHIGDSIRPIGQSYNMFVQLIAFVFAAQGLFPRNHPALQETQGGAPAAQLRLQDVIGTAYRKLSFTREGLPKVLIFFAVVGSMAVSVLGLITAFMSLMVGHAHAQTPFFTVPDANNDIGYNLIEYLFNPTTWATYGGNLSTLYNTATGKTMETITTQVALWSALSIYSSAMLIFAAIVLFYHLAKMVVDTAHSGVTMGRSANQIWAPIRLVAAVALLVPISNGLNSGQFIVVKLAEIGSNLGSYVWGQYVATIINDSATFATPSPGNIASIVTTLASDAACEYAFNYQMAKTEAAQPFDMTTQFVNSWTNGASPGAIPTTWNAGGIPSNGVAFDPNAIVINQPDGSIQYHYQAPTPNATDTDLCGSVTQPAAPNFSNGTTQTIAMAIYNAQLAAFNGASSNIMSWGGQKMANCCITDLEGTGSNNVNVTGAPIGTIIDQYQSALITGIQGAMGAAGTLPQVLAGTGWMGAGGFYNQIAQIQSNIDAQARIMPTVSPPQITNVALQTNSSPYIPVDDEMTAFNQTVAASFIFASNSPVGNTIPSTVTATQNTSSLGALWHNLHWNNPVEDIFAIADWFAAYNGVWSQTTAGNKFNLGVQFSGAWPLAQIADFGARNVNTGFGIMNLGLLFATGGSITSLFPAAIFPVTGAVSKILGGIGMGLMGIGSLFFTIGFLMGFVLPLIPFMHFFFGAISWLALLFEAVIAIPIIALGHITPEGEGLPGPMASRAYFMVFSLVLRPVLMIFGLICGFMILTMAVTLLNLLYTSAVQAVGTGNSVAAGGYTVFVRIAYTIIYCALIISIANHAFRLITQIPDRVMSWISGADFAGHQMGNAEQIETLATVGAGYAGKTMMSGAAGGILQAGNAGGQAISQGISNKQAGQQEDRALFAQGFQRDPNNPSGLIPIDNGRGGGGSGGPGQSGTGGGGGFGPADAMERAGSGEPNNESLQTLPYSGSGGGSGGGGSGGGSGGGGRPAATWNKNLDGTMTQR